MTGDLIAGILKAGMISFVGSRLMRALNQKEISEIIAASGWCVIGINGSTIVLNAIKWINNMVDKGQAFGDKIELFFDKIDIFNII